jgi:sugar O-acyltransferase (sialic acid O-acetyltransferase NeuD family)
MLIIGAKGFASELLNVLHQLRWIEGLAFFDDVSHDLPDMLFRKFEILRHESAVKSFFEVHGNSFCLGLGKPVLREMLDNKLSSWGGGLTSVVSLHAQVGTFAVSIGAGATILPNACITAAVDVGRAQLMYPNAIITHNCQLGDFVELSPGATILGNCTIGSYTHIGANSTILPNVSVGSNVILGAGAVVDQHVPDNCLVVGAPAKVIRQLSPLNGLN